jgi:hypothetical protein
MSTPGLIREHPNFRTAPNLDSAVIRVLDPGTPVEVIARIGDYFGVLVDGQGGFIHVDFVIPNPEGLPAEPPEIGDVAQPPPPPPASADSLAASAALASAALAPPDNELVGGNSSLARVWNQYGGLISTLSNQLGVDPAVAVATLAVESGGRAAGQDGRMLIRFENHIFHQFWGADNPGLFFQHFSFASDRNWLGHHWRPSADESWRASHVDDQAVEWAAFEFGRTLDETAATLSISMGLTQVMGFNHQTLGYGSPQVMFEAFSRGPRYQVIGFFDFVKRNGGVPFLQNHDYAAFARMYNGVGQIGLYAGLIRDSVAEFRRLRGL